MDIEYKTHVPIKSQGCKRQKRGFALIYVVKSYRGRRVKLHPFFASALDRGEWSETLSGGFTLWNEALSPLNKRLEKGTPDQVLFLFVLGIKMCEIFFSLPEGLL